MVVQHNQPGSTDQSVIRNFCIIAHIDHGKSTVADRILQLSGIVPEREMRDRFLDRMDIEQERGITIKSQAVRVPWTFDGTEYTLGMIDTPGHVDFTYEVSRALAACEGAVLLVDATQGIEAQTLSNLYMAIDHDLAIIPVLNKIDLPSAEPDKHAEEIAGLIGCEPSDVLRVSGKTGEGVADLLDQIVMDVPAPHGDPEAPARALIFDIIVAEYDGMAKYADISNKNRASLQAKMEYDRRRDRHLREQGVTEIVHVFYEDLLRPINLETKLLKAGVPKIR